MTVEVQVVLHLAVLLLVRAALPLQPVLLVVAVAHRVVLHRQERRLFPAVLKRNQEPHLVLHVTYQDGAASGGQGVAFISEQGSGV